MGKCRDRLGIITCTMAVKAVMELGSCALGRLKAVHEARHLSRSSGGEVSIVRFIRLWLDRVSGHGEVTLAPFSMAMSLGRG